MNQIGTKNKKRYKLNYMILFFLFAGFSFLFPQQTIAGCYPEDFISNDNAKLYIIEIVKYDSVGGSIIVQPIMKIKGDVSLKESKKFELTGNDLPPTYNKDTIYNVDNKNFYKNEQGLVVELERNQHCMFHITGDTLKSLEIKNLDKEHMWMRVQKYLNDGTYEEAEKIRLEKLGKNSENKSSNVLPPKKNVEKGNQTWLFILLFLVFSIILFMKKEGNLRKAYN